MEEVLKYLDTIAAIDAIERSLAKRNVRSKQDLTADEAVKLKQAYDAANAAWAAIPPDLQQNLYPPPARETSVPASGTTPRC